MTTERTEDAATADEAEVVDVSGYQPHVPAFATKELKRAYNQFAPAELHRFPLSNYQPPHFLGCLVRATGRSLSEAVLSVLVSEDGAEETCGNRQCGRVFRPVRVMKLNLHRLNHHKEDQGVQDERVVTMEAVRQLGLVPDEFGDEEEEHLRMILPYISSYPDPFAGIPVVSGSWVIGPNGPVPYCGCPWWGDPRDGGGRFYRPSDEGCLAVALAALKGQGLRAYSYARYTTEVGVELQNRAVARLMEQAAAMKDGVRRICDDLSFGIPERRLRSRVEDRRGHDRKGGYRHPRKGDRR